MRIRSSRFWKSRRAAIGQYLTGLGCFAWMRSTRHLADPLKRLIPSVNSGPLIETRYSKSLA